MADIKHSVADFNAVLGTSIPAGGGMVEFCLMARALDTLALYRDELVTIRV